jgi:hypothetical protein
MAWLRVALYDMHLFSRVPLNWLASVPADSFGSVLSRVCSLNENYGDLLISVWSSIFHILIDFMKFYPSQKNATWKISKHLISTYPQFHIIIARRFALCYCTLKQAFTAKSSDYASLISAYYLLKE